MLNVTPPALPTAPSPVDPEAATAFVEQYVAESSALDDAHLTERLAEVRREIDATGTYRHTPAELAYGARLAWRNSDRCIGRLYWQSLHVRDRRTQHTAEQVIDECITHLVDAFRGGDLRSTITIFAPNEPGRPGPRILNDQLIRYAWHEEQRVGDPAQAEATARAQEWGWTPPARPGRFDPLPLMVEADGERAWRELPPDAVQEVEITHPELPWFADLGLRWHAVPAISSMPLVIGGVRYSAAPFNGWYLSTEIGARNFADVDRYDLLPEVGRLMGLDTSSDRTLWRDRAAIELTAAVTHSFDAAGVRLADHHSESRRFLAHVDREARRGRGCPADWSWIVPPISGGLTPVFHRYYDPPLTSPTACFEQTPSGYHGG